MKSELLNAKVQRRQGAKVQALTPEPRHFGATRMVAATSARIFWNSKGGSTRFLVFLRI